MSGRLGSGARWAAPRVGVLLLLAVASCSWSGIHRGAVLREYWLVLPREQVGRPIWLSSYASEELAGSLSPDGTRLVYAGDQKGQFDIWIKDLTTGVPQRVTRNAAEDTQPAWAPDGRSIVFVSRREDAKGDLYLWRDGALKRLTDERTADAYPVFAPDGRTIYFASGAVGRSRIVRLNSATGRVEAVSPWGATHPAISPHGRYLAYTWFDAEGRGRVRLQRVADHHSWVVTPGDYPAGFPTFSPDGRYLAFCRFHRGPPAAHRQPDASASLWRVRLPRLSKLQSIDRFRIGPADMDQLTSDATNALLPRWHDNGIVVSMQRLGSLDIGLLPARGLVPRRPSGQQQLKLARNLNDPWDRLLALHAVLKFPEQRAEATYESALLWAGLGEFAKAQRQLEALATDDRLRKDPHAQLARIELVALGVERNQHRSTKVELAAQARSALQRLAATRDSDTALETSRVTAHRLLRTGDLQKLSGNIQGAIDTYRALLARSADRPDLAARAQLRLAAVYSQLGAKDLTIAYFLSLLDAYPRQTAVLREASQAAVAQIEKLPAMQQLEQLRRLVDEYASHPIFVMTATRRMASLYESQNQLDLAIGVLNEGLMHQRESDQMSTEAAFTLGRLALRRSRELKVKGRFGEALELYERALLAYERLVADYPPETPTHERARREYLRLSLLDAEQLEKAGEGRLAEKRYRRILAFDDQVVQAHRGLIRLAIGGADPGSDTAARARKRLVDTYQRRLRKDGSDFVALYALGYLATMRHPLRLDGLDEAERWLERAIALRPQNPFGHMTLGWVYEMRERAFGQHIQGWLEEAILHYNRAYALNDAKLDSQTEADLLIDLANAFAALGSSWNQVHAFCKKRRELAHAFSSVEQEAYHRLTCGRAASALGKLDQARLAFEQALTAARKLRLTRLEVEALARLALNEHLRGDFAASNRLFEQMTAILRRQKQTKALAAIERSIAYNSLLSGDRRAAAERLRRAEKTLDRFGTAEVPQFIAVTPKPSASTLPIGMDALAARYAQLGFEEILQEADGRWDRARNVLEKQVRLQQRRIQAASDFTELKRELLLLRNRVAMTALRVGDRQMRSRQLQQAGHEAEALLAKTSELDEQTFAIRVGLALNGAEASLEDASSSSELRSWCERLQQLEDQRAKLVAARGRTLLSERLRFALWTDLAAISVLTRLPGAGNAGGTVLVSPPSVVPALQRSIEPVSSHPIDRAIAAMLKAAAPLTGAMELLRRVVDQTAESRSEPAGEALAAGASGVTAALWRPLSAMERLRWHLQAVLNLSCLAALWVPPEQLEAHPSTDLLRRAAQLIVDHDLGALRYVLSAELAYRRRDLRAMGAAVEGFINRHPLLLGRAYQTDVGILRSRIFSRAVALALELGQPEAVLEFAELEERRAFVDALVSLPPGAQQPAVKQALDQLFTEAVRYRDLYERQDPRQNGKIAQQWRAEIEEAERRVREQIEALAAATGPVAKLLRVGAFSVKALQQQLNDGEVALRAVAAGSRVALIAVPATGKPRLIELPQSLTRLQVRAQRQKTQVAAELARTIEPLIGRPTRLLLDLGAIDATLGSSMRVGNAEVVQLSTLWELLDARAARRAALDGVVTVAGGPLAVVASSTDRRLALAPARSLLPRIEQASARAGVLVIGVPVRFAGRSPANAVVAMDPNGAALADADWRPGYTLGQPLRCTLVVLPDVRFHPGLERKQRVALLRLMHAMGVPNVAIGTSAAGPAVKPERLMKSLARIKPDGIAKAMRESGLTLYGDGGVPPAQRVAFSRAKLREAVFAGARAFNQQPRRLADTVRWLLDATHHMAYLHDTKNPYLAGALLYLANARALQHDYVRAMRHMQRLLDLRREALRMAQSSGAVPAVMRKGIQDYAVALQQMARLRAHERQYKAALEVNGQAIELTLKAGLLPLTRHLYEQRSLISEQKGDFGQALAYGRRNLQLAQRTQQGSQSAPPLSSQRLAVANAGIRVARLLRQRFSRFGEAMHAIQIALSQLPDADPQGLQALKAKLAQITSSKAANPSEPAKTLIAQAKRLRGQADALRRVIVARHEALLERARIQTARGIYADAVRLARQALQLMHTAELPEDRALLELVNNLYYMGSYREVLQLAQHGLKISQADPLRRIQFLNARGTALAALGRTDAALEALHEALSVARTQQAEEEIAATHNNIGNARRLAGRYQEARDSFTAALKLDRRRQDKLGMSFDLANRGLSQALLGLDDEAIDDLEAAQRLAGAIGAPLNQLKALAGLARIDLAQKNPGRALKRVHQAQAIANRLGLRNWTWRFYYLAGLAYLQLGKANRARRELTAGVDVIDSRPPHAAPVIGTPRTEERPEDVYDQLIDLLAQQGLAEPALSLVERRRARNFADRVGASALDIPWPAARQALRDLAELHATIEAARAARMRVQTDDQARRQETEQIAQLQQQIEAARSGVRALNPRLLQLIYPQTRPLSELYDALRTHADTALVSFYATKTTLLIWVWDPVSKVEGTAEMRRQPSHVPGLRMISVPVDRGTLRHAVKRFRTELMRFHDVKAVGRQLYDWLMKPVLAQTEAPRLLIVASGFLQLVPIVALYDGKDYVLERRVITYLPALSMLERRNDVAGDRSARQGQPRRWLSVSWTGDADQPLPFSARESDALAQTFDAVELLQGGAASKDAVLGAVYRATNLHIATHARFNPDDPLSSGFNTSDGQVSLVEILGQRLPAALVLLSSCDTGVAPMEAADGAAGMHRLFMVAGAQQVVSSLWRVSDLGAALLMKAFFRQLKRQSDVALALQRAQRQLRRRLRHPGFWSAFRIDG